MKIQDGHLAAILNFQSAPKWKFTFVYYVPINVQNFISIAQMLLEILRVNENPRWPLGGHIEFPIGCKIKIYFWLICTNKCAKFHINCLNASWDIERKWKSKIAAWRPYWISDRHQKYKLFKAQIDHHFGIQSESTGSLILDEKSFKKS